MEALFIFMGLLLMSMAYDYDDKIDYRTRYGLHKRYRTQFGRPAFSKMQYSRAQFRTPQFQRPQLRNHFHPRLYSEKYLRERSAYPSLSPWLRKKYPAIKLANTPVEYPKNPKASLSIFRTIEMKQTNAILVKNETKFPWIARVVATPNSTSPVICTAACIEERIFVTTATCLLNAKVYYTRVFYQDVALQPLAFVLPSKPTKTMFHDLGLIIVDRNFKKPWQIIKSYFMVNKFEKPDDETFNWTMKAGWSLRVIGFVNEPSKHEYAAHIPNDIVYSLYELEVLTHPLLCNYLLNQHPPSEKFFVPCYSPCNLSDYNQNLSKCYDYLAGEGHVVIGRNTGLLIGVASWGSHYKNDLNKPHLPVGIATTNSLAFEEDYECALKIAKAPEASEKFDTFCQ